MKKAEPKVIPLDPIDMRVIDKYAVAIREADAAKAGLLEYLSSIVRRSGYGQQKWDLKGNQIIIRPAE
jgi:hypothetical protein